MNNPSKKIFIGLILTLATILMIIAVVLLVPSVGLATPKITWTPSQVMETVAQGQTKTTAVSFTSTQNLTNVVVWIVPELSPYVSTTPSSFPSISAGATVSLTLTFSAPTDAPLETFDGTLHLKDAGGKSQKTYVKPLPIMLTIVWPVFESANGEIQLQYPGTLVVTEHESTDDTQVIEFSGETTGEGFTVEIVEANPQSLDLITWADQQQWPFPDDWRNHFTITSVFGLEVLQDSLTGSVIFTKGVKVYFITNGIGRDPIPLDIATFQTILGSLQVLN